MPAIKTKSERAAIAALSRSGSAATGMEWSPCVERLWLGISVGWMEWTALGDGLEAIQFHVSNRSHKPSELPQQGVLSLALTQWQRYLEDPARPFDLPLRRQGTPFQQRVYAALQGIPPGTVSTYGKLATALNSSPRAVAAALRANPYPVVTPCHRIVAKDHLGGYFGCTEGPLMTIKRWLLWHEGVPGIEFK